MNIAKTLIAVLALAVGAVLTPGLATATRPIVCQPQDAWIETSTQTRWAVEDPGAPWVATGNTRTVTEATPDTFAWVDDGEPVRTEDNTPPAADTDLSRYLLAGTVDDSIDGGWDNEEVVFYTWTGDNSGEAPPVYADETQTALHPNWDATNGNPQGPHAEAALYTPYEVGNGPNTASWFLKAGVYVPGVEDTDYWWQRQVRTVVSVIEAEYTRVVTIDHPAVICDDNEPKPPVVHPNPPNPQPNPQPNPEPAPKPASKPKPEPVAVPTSVDAGL